MKYLIGGLFTILILGMIACSNDKGSGNVKRKSDVDHRDLRIFRGSAEGAKEVFPDTIKLIHHLDIKDIVDEYGEIIKKDTTILSDPDTIYLDVDSLYRELVMNKYFSSIYSNEVQSRNDIQFEFLPDEPTLMRYVERNPNLVTIISTYQYNNNELEVLKGGVTPVYVAYVDEKTGEYYRDLGLELPLIKDKNEENGDFVSGKPLEPMDKEVITLESALKKIGFDDPKDFKNPKDSVIWVNLKYYFR